MPGIPRFVHRHLTTIVVAAAVAAVTAGGPAVAATVVAYAKNAGAVDGLSAVKANATVDQRKGKLVATAKKSGLLPNNIIAQAPDSAKLGGVPLSGLAAHYLSAHGSWAPTTTAAAYCATTVITPMTNSIAVVNVSADASATAATLFAVQAAFSTDGGTTFTRTVPNWYVGATSPASGYSSASNSANVSLSKGQHYAFALFGFAQAAMSGDCSVTVAIYPDLPGTTLTAPTTPSVATPARRSTNAINAGR